MKMLITGGTGLLGSECARVLAEGNQVWAPGSHDLDITSVKALARAFACSAPEVVINCAAFTDVDACEQEREQAWRVNVVGTQNLATHCRRYGSLLVHLSTDYIFDGTKPLPEGYVEEDLPAPLSFYGATKLESERVVQSTTEVYCIVRTAWLYGIRRNNFLKKILARVAAQPHQEIQVVADRFGSPTWARRLAQQIARIIASGERGIFHATAQGFCSWYEFACFFLAQLGIPHRIVPCSGSSYPAAAPRPVNSLLSNKRLMDLGIASMRHWQEDVRAFVQESREELLLEAGLPVIESITD